MMDKNDRDEMIQRAIMQLRQSDLIRAKGKKFWSCTDKSYIWRPLPKDEVNARIRALCFPDATYCPSEILNEIRKEIQTSPSLQFQNRVLQTGRFIITKKEKIDLQNLQSHPLKKEDFFQHGIDFEFQADAVWSKAPFFCHYVNSSLNIDLVHGNRNEPKRKLLCQILVYLTSRLYGAKKMIILLGPSNSGKSVFLGFLRRLVGADGYVPLTLNDLSERFRGSSATNVGLIINDELACKGIGALDQVKRFISGEPVCIEQKYEDATSWTPRIKLIFGANSLPALKEYDSECGFANRIQVLAFSNAIPPENWDFELVNKLYCERNIIISAAIKEVGNFIQSLVFTKVDESDQLLAVYKENNLSVRTFIDDAEWCIKKSNERVSTAILYEKYTVFCKENCIEPVKISVFRNQLQQLGFNKIKARYNGKSVSCISGLRLFDELLDNKEK